MNAHELDSGALQTLNEVLGATGGTQHTYIDSGNLQLALNANDIVRRGRTFASSEGIFGARMTNTHAGAGAISLTVDPYAVVTPGAGFKSPMPRGFDVWLLSAWASAGIGVASATLANRLVIQHPATSVAFGAAGTVGQLVKLFAGENAISATVAFLRDANVGTNPFPSGSSSYMHPAWRIPRGALLLWATNAAIAGDIIVELELGVFPSGLGQDARS